MGKPFYLVKGPANITGHLYKQTERRGYVWIFCIMKDGQEKKLPLKIKLSKLTIHGRQDRIEPIGRRSTKRK